jgi:mannose-1-phosphate guanylyltransferase
LKAAILAGGFGTRMRPLTYTRPKPLLPILNVPMLRRLIDRVPPEVDGVVLAVNYLADQIANYLRQEPPPVPVEVVEEVEPLGTGGAVKNLEAFLGGGRFLVMNGDVICDADLGTMVDAHVRRGGVGTIHLWPVEDPSRYGVVRLDEAGAIRQFVEKPAPGTAPSDLINAGTYVLEPSVLDHIPAGRAVSMEREVFPVLAREGLFGHRGGTFWVDAGQPADYIHAHRLLMGASPASYARPAPPGATVHAPCLVPADASLEAGAVVGPFASLGAGVLVGARAHVKDSVLLAGSAVGRDAVVEGAVLGYGARVGRGARLAPGTVVADGEAVADGRVTEPGEKVGGRPA